MLNLFNNFMNIFGRSLNIQIKIYFLGQLYIIIKTKKVRYYQYKIKLLKTLFRFIINSLDISKDKYTFVKKLLFTINLNKWKTYFQF